MQQLMVLYVGTIFLAYLSQCYYPQRQDQIGHKHFLLTRTDLFVLAIIIWFALFNGLKTSYNDVGTYIAFYEESESSLFGYLAGDVGYTDNLFFYGLQAIFKGVINNYHVWFVFVAAINAIAITKILKRKLQVQVEHFRVKV